MIYLYWYILFLSIDSDEEEEILSILRDRLQVEGIGNEDEEDDDDAMETDEDDGINTDEDGWGTTCGRPSGLPFTPPRPPGPRLGMDRDKTALDFFQRFVKDSTLE